jgi:hypothetical protein
MTTTPPKPQVSLPQSENASWLMSKPCVTKVVLCCGTKITKEEEDGIQKVFYF